MLINVQAKDARIAPIANTATIANGQQATLHYFARAPAQVSLAGFMLVVVKLPHTRTTVAHPRQTAASCKDFTKEDTQEVCQAREAAVIAMAAYDSRKRYCCKEGSNYIKSSEQCCENCEVPREDCVKDSKCTQECKFYTEVPDKRKGNITPEDYWGFAGALQGFRKHTGTKYMLGKIEGLPFSISGHIGSTVFVSFKGSGADVGDWAANSRTIANKFTAQEWNLGGEQPHLYAHRGFLGYYDTIKVSIFKHVDEMVMTKIARQNMPVKTIRILLQCYG